MKATFNLPNSLRCVLVACHGIVIDQISWLALALLAWGHMPKRLCLSLGLGKAILAGKGEVR